MPQPVLPVPNPPSTWRLRNEDSLKVRPDVAPGLVATRPDPLPAILIVRSERWACAQFRKDSTSTSRAPLRYVVNWETPLSCTGSGSSGSSLPAMMTVLAMLYVPLASRTVPPLLDWAALMAD